MSDSPVTTTTRGTRPVSIGSVLGVFIGCALFLALVYFLYMPRRTPTPMPYNLPAENVEKDQAWKSTPSGRREYLTKLRQEQQDKAAHYGWVDQSKGIVRLPIDRAMELTLTELNSRKAAPPAPANAQK
jgi:hypothetical protein